MLFSLTLTNLLLQRNNAFSWKANAIDFPGTADFSLLQNIPHKIVILRELRKVIVPTAMNAYQGDLSRIYFL